MVTLHTLIYTDFALVRELEFAFQYIFPVQVYMTTVPRPASSRHEPKLQWSVRVSSEEKEWCIQPSADVRDMLSFSGSLAFCDVSPFVLPGGGSNSDGCPKLSCNLWIVYNHLCVCVCIWIMKNQLEDHFWRSNSELRYIVMSHACQPNCLHTNKNTNNDTTNTINNILSKSMRSRTHLRVIETIGILNVRCRTVVG